MVWQDSMACPGRHTLRSREYYAGLTGSNTHFQDYGKNWSAEKLLYKKASVEN